MTILYSITKVTFTLLSSHQLSPYTSLYLSEKAAAVVLVSAEDCGEKTFSSHP